MKENILNTIKAISGMDCWFSYSVGKFGPFQSISPSEFFEISSPATQLKMFIDKKEAEHKLEIDDLKLRICVLEDAMKEHSHISARDMFGISDVGIGKIPSRKK